MKIIPLIKAVFLLSLLNGQILLAAVYHDIVGGTPARPGQWPWMVYLTMLDNHTETKCGGMLIEKNKVLTAAHCVDGEDQPIPTAIVIGRITRSDQSQGEVVAIQNIIIHPEYDDDYDIALIELEKNISHIKPLALYPHEAKGRAITIGWGNTSNDPDSASDHLMQVNVPIVEHNKCQKAMGQYKNITDNMLCAGYDRGGRDACFGDSGGPLITFNQQSRQWELIGVVSSGGEYCAQPNEYGIYTKVLTTYPF